MAERELSVVKDLTECCICTEVMWDPRVLPCQHTFCLKCLLEWGKDKQPGNRLPCPLCRKQFIIPANGLSGTQKDYAIAKLLSAMELSQGSIFSPLLFIIFINDLVDVCEENIKMYLFADDANMYCHIKNVADKDKL